MAKNIIPDIAKMLGVEIGEEFEVEGLDGRYKLTEDSLRIILLSGKWACASTATFYWLCKGKYKIIKLPFKPKYGEPFCYIRTNGCVDWDTFSDHIFSASMYLIGNCFRTEEEASAHKDEIMTKFKEVLE